MTAATTTTTTTTRPISLEFGLKPPQGGSSAESKYLLCQWCALGPRRRSLAPVMALLAWVPRLSSKWPRAESAEATRRQIHNDVAPSLDGDWARLIAASAAQNTSRDLPTTSRSGLGHWERRKRESIRHSALTMPIRRQRRILSTETPSVYPEESAIGARPRKAALCNLTEINFGAQLNTVFPRM
jgi:hypothetical protein